MRQPTMSGMARAACLGSIAAFGLLMVEGRPAGAQSPVSNSGDTTRGSLPGRAPGAQGVPNAQESQMLVVHGLEMAIEGSTLQALAMQPSGMSVGVRPGAATPAAPVAAGASLSTLQQQAMHAFESGDRLLGQAGREGADARLQQAATRYVATLKGLSARPAGTVPVAVGNGTGGRETYPSATSATGFNGTGAAAVNGGMVNTPDPASVALINHAVKEAIAGLKIRQMARSMGSIDNPAAQLLLNHARDMEAEGRLTIQAMAGGGQGVMAQPMAQQAIELIAAFQGFIGEPAIPVR